MYLRVSIETRKRLNELKWSQEKFLMNWLKEERVFIQLDRWRTERSKVIGFITRVHPTLSWKPDYKEELICQLKDTDYGGYEKTKWLKRQEGLEEGIIPEFQWSTRKRDSELQKREYMRWC